MTEHPAVDGRILRVLTLTTARALSLWKGDVG